MRVIIKRNSKSMGEWIAIYIVEKINNFIPTKEKPYFILGLPIGESSWAMYKEFIELFRDNLVSFKNVVIFNILHKHHDTSDNQVKSNSNFLYINFFKYIDIPLKNINIFYVDFENKSKNSSKIQYQKYIEKIKYYGGMDIFVGGVADNGNISFNEFNICLNLSRNNEIPIGIGIIFEIQEVLIIANGYSTSKFLWHAIEGSINHLYNISALQLHNKGIIICDEEAISEVKVKTYNYYKSIELSI